MQPLKLGLSKTLSLSRPDIFQDVSKLFRTSVSIDLILIQKVAFSTYKSINFGTGFLFVTSYKLKNQTIEKDSKVPVGGVTIFIALYLRKKYQIWCR